MWRQSVRLYAYLCAWFLVALVWVAILAKQPLRNVRAEDPVAAPPYPGRVTNSDSPIWVVVSPREEGEEESAGGFSSLDAGAFWINPALHEFGSARLVAPRALSEGIPDDIRVVVVTEQAQASAGRAMARLEAFVHDGGALFLENPRPDWFGLAGVSERSSDNVRVDMLDIRGADAGLACLPVSLRPVRLSPGVSATVSGRIPGSDQGVPMVWRRALGRGVVVGLAWDFGKTLVSRVQGTPREDFTFQPRPRTGALDRIPLPSDMVADYPECREPAVDRLERAVWWSGLEVVAVPAWWPYPDGASAAYLSTHDEEGFGDRSLFMVEEEARRGEVATYFVLPQAITAAGIARMERQK